MDMAAAGKQLPVFVFPSAVLFYSNDQATYKQIITLYNPYDFNLRFKVLSTAPHRYNVVDSDGIIRSKCCVDVIIRHNDVMQINENVRDKFRIQVSDCNTRKVLGFKDVVAMLLPKKEYIREQMFQSLPENRNTPSPVQQNFAPGVHPSKANFIILITALSCVVTLILPSQNDESGITGYLRVSVNQKLIAAYILGLLTMVLLRA